MDDAAPSPLVKAPPPWARVLGCGCGILALLLGLVVIGFVVWQLRVDDEFADRAIAVPGEVVRISEHTGRSGAGRYGRSRTTTIVSTINYIDREGRRHQFQERQSDSSGQRSKGDKITVLYDPENPKKVVVDDYLGRRAGSMAGLIFGLFFAGLGVVFLYLVLRDHRARRRRKAEDAVAASHESGAEERRS